METQILFQFDFAHNLLLEMQLLRKLEAVGTGLEKHHFSTKKIWLIKYIKIIIIVNNIY
jgi:hypothetical protein